LLHYFIIGGKNGISLLSWWRLMTSKEVWWHPAPQPGADFNILIEVNASVGNTSPLLSTLYPSLPLPPALSPLPFITSFLFPPSLSLLVPKP